MVLAKEAATKCKTEEISVLPSATDSVLASRASPAPWANGTGVTLDRTSRGIKRAPDTVDTGIDTKRVKAEQKSQHPGLETLPRYRDVTPYKVNREQLNRPAAFGQPSMGPQNPQPTIDKIRENRLPDYHVAGHLQYKQAVEPLSTGEVQETRPAVDGKLTVYREPTPFVTGAGWRSPQHDNDDEP